MPAREKNTARAAARSDKRGSGAPARGSHRSHPGHRGTGRGDAAAALATTDAVCAAAAQGRRLLKAAASGRKPRGTGPAARPGQLRDLVAAHLTAHPDADFTPHQIGRVLARSSGAVANALDKLTALGQAQMTCEKPRRYQAAASAPAPAGTT